MNNKDKTHILNEMFRIGLTGILCFCSYCWGTDYEKARFAITLGTITYLIICFYNVIFNKKYKEMFERILSGLIIVAFSNELYSYNKVVALFPIFKNTDPMLFSLIILGAVLLLLIVIKIMIFIYENTDANGTQFSEDNYIYMDGNAVENNNMEGKLKSKNNNTWMILYFVFLVILIGAGCALFNILYDKGVLEQNYDFFEVVSFLLKYAGYIVLIFIAIVTVVILLIEMIRLIILRMKVFVVSLKNDGQENDSPLYLLSIIIDIVICYLTYRFTGIDMDSFYNFANGGKYIALPLMILFVGIAFVIFRRLIHATLVLLVDMRPAKIKSFLEKINNENQITHRIVEIIKKIIDIIFSTVLTALNFVSFIPDYFGSLYIFVLEDEEDFEMDDDEAKDSSETRRCGNE